MKVRLPEQGLWEMMDQIRSLEQVIHWLTTVQIEAEDPKASAGAWRAKAPLVTLATRMRGAVDEVLEEMARRLEIR